MSLNRLHPFVYLAIAVVVPAVVDLRHIGIQGRIGVVTVADGGVVVGGLIPGAVPPSDAGPVSPSVHVQIDAPQATGRPGAIGADRGGFALLHGLTVALEGFGGTGKQQDEGDHGRGVA